MCSQLNLNVRSQLFYSRVPAEAVTIFNCASFQFMLRYAQKS